MCRVKLVELQRLYEKRELTPAEGPVTKSFGVDNGGRIDDMQTFSTEIHHRFEAGGSRVRVIDSGVEEVNQTHFNGVWEGKYTDLEGYFPKTNIKKGGRLP